MKKLLLLALLSLTACHNHNDYNSPYNPYQPLLTESRITTNTATCASAAGMVVNSGLDKNRNGALDASEITQSQIVCDGVAGQNGSDGSNGTNGSDGAQGPQGASGQNGTNGTNGQDGAQGPQGIAGQNGSNGVSCTVTQIIPSSSYPLGGAQLTCGTQVVVVFNGAAGSNAQSYTVVQEITPCGAASSPWKEVLLQLAGGDLLGSFSDNASGLNTRFSNIPDGGYVDTDNSGCNFTVSTSGSTRSISWAAGHNSYSTWAAQTISWPVY